MGGCAWGPMGLAAPRAWGPPQRRSSPRAGRQMGQVGLGRPRPQGLASAPGLPVWFVHVSPTGLSCCSFPSPALPPSDGSSDSLPWVPAVSLLAVTSLPPALPPTQSYPSRAVPRTLEQQGL